MASERIIRVGIIGADTKMSWAGPSHVPALAGLPGFKLSAVATRSADSAREAAAAYGADHWFDDAMAMIGSDEVDLVTVAVRVPAHRDLVLAAIAAGEPIYCESPLGVSVAETQEMADAARAAGVPTVIGLQSRYNPALRRAAELVASGAIGRPLTARVISTTSGFGPAFPAAYDYFNKPEAGANLLTISVGHTLDAVEAVLGAVAEVDARSAILYPSVQLVDTGATSTRGTADQVSVLGRTNDGCEFVVDVNGNIPIEEANFVMEVRGTDGWLKLIGGTLFGFQGGDLTLTSSATFDPPEVPAAGADAPAPAINVAEAYAAIGRDIREGSNVAKGFAHAVHNARLIAAVAEAARTGTRQQTPTA